MYAWNMHMCGWMWFGFDCLLYISSFMTIVVCYIAVHIAVVAAAISIQQWTIASDRSIFRWYVQCNLNSAIPAQWTKPPSSGQHWSTCGRFAWSQKSFSLVWWISRCESTMAQSDCSLSRVTTFSIHNVFHYFFRGSKRFCPLMTTSLLSLEFAHFSISWIRHLFFLH